MNNDLFKILRNFFFSNIDEEAVQLEVRRLRDEYPDLSSYEICDILIRKTALTSSAAGSVTGVLPWPLPLLFAAPDFFFTFAAQAKMILKIAVLAGKDISDDLRFDEIIGCIGVSAGAVAGTIGIRKIVESGVSPFLLSFILKSFMKTFSSKLIPMLGALSGGIMNFSATLAVGCAARNFYFPDSAEIIGTKDFSDSEAGGNDDDNEEEEELPETELEFENDDEEEDEEDEEEDEEEDDEDEEEDEEEDDEDEEEDEEDEDEDDEDEEEEEDGKKSMEDKTEKRSEPADRTRNRKK